MKNSWILLYLSFFFSCSAPTKPTDTEKVDIDTSAAETDLQYNIFVDNSSQDAELYQTVFPYVLDQTHKRNPSLFKQKLADYYELKFPFKVLEVQSTQLYGTKMPVYLVHCFKEQADSNCLFPAQHIQFLFSHQGKLIYRNSAEIAKFVPFTNDSMTLYMTVQVGCDGMGKHHFYKYQAGKLIDLYNVIMNNSPFSYDANPQNGMLANKVLRLQIKDLNEDGLEDIQLSGVLISAKLKRNKKDTIYSRKTIDYRFIYQPGKDFFHWQN